MLNRQAELARFNLECAAHREAHQGQRRRTRRKTDTRGCASPRLSQAVSGGANLRIPLRTFVLFVVQLPDLG